MSKGCFHNPYLVTTSIRSCFHAWNTFLRYFLEWPHFQIVTGSVSKKKSHIHRGMLNRDYNSIRLHERELQRSIRTGDRFRICFHFATKDQIFCAIHCRANAAQFIGIIPTYLHPHFNNYDLRSEFHKVKQKQRTRVSFVEQNELDVSWHELTIAMQYPLEIVQKLLSNWPCPSKRTVSSEKLVRFSGSHPIESFTLLELGSSPPGSFRFDRFRRTFQVTDLTRKLRDSHMMCRLESASFTASNTWVSNPLLSRRFRLSATDPNSCIAFAFGVPRTIDEFYLSSPNSMHMFETQFAGNMSFYQLRWYNARKTRSIELTWTNSLLDALHLFMISKTCS